MTRQKAFELFWADQHAVPVEALEQYRWADQDGYRLHNMATAYRGFCGGWDASRLSLEVKLPSAPVAQRSDEEATFSAGGCNMLHKCRTAIEAQGLRVTS